MEHINNKILQGKSNWLFHTIYWLMAAMLIYFIFSNSKIALELRLPMVLLLVIFGFGTTCAINRFIIPKYLFTGKTLLAFYMLLVAFMVALWISFMAIFGLVYISAVYMPFLIIPRWEDIIIIIAGNFLIITLAVVIHFIRESFRQMAAKNEVLSQKAEAESKLKDAQLKLLQGQIHPHFLFNMLNNLYAMMRIDIDLSRKTIIQISDLLDYMLYKCSEEKTDLTNEVKFIENYIELERIRHSGDFNVVFNYPERLDQIKIAPLILFPFVENAFKHGFRNADKGEIFISISLSENYIDFQCQNSLSKKQTNDDKYLQQEGKGIGLKNIQERLDILYKNKYNFTVEETENQFKVALQLAWNNE